MRNSADLDTAVAALYEESRRPAPSRLGSQG
jgi:hypothetical protein